MSIRDILDDFCNVSYVPRFQGGKNNHLNITNTKPVERASLRVAFVSNDLPLSSKQNTLVDELPMKYRS